MKIYGNWGLFYTKVPNDLAARALSADAGVSRARLLRRGLTQPVPDGTLAAGTTTHFIALGAIGRRDRSECQGELRQRGHWPASSVEALPGLNLGVRYIHRNIPRVLEDVQPFPDRRRRSRAFPAPRPPTTR